MACRIVLASGSPRRRQLLQQIGLTELDVRIPGGEEAAPPGLSPQETVAHICRQKALSATRLCQADELFITADTMVFLDGASLGKPRDEADALRMLTALQGRCHSVCTAVTVGRGQRMETECETTLVTFRSASRHQLLSYIATGEPMDKAGAYGVQGRGALLVERIEGDYFNVMGLPLMRLSKMLERFGVQLL